MKLWRIAAETRKYAADHLSGAGAAASLGRWNDENEAIVYCAPTIAMAVLETAAHIDDAGLPLNKYLVEIDVPDGAWLHSEEVNITTLPATWRPYQRDAEALRLVRIGWHRFGHLFFSCPL